jgi:hypothetical protein
MESSLKGLEKIGALSFVSIKILMFFDVGKKNVQLRKHETNRKN